MTKILLFLSVLTFADNAIAGTLTVRDDAKVMTSVEVEHLRKAAERWPFDAHVIVAEVRERLDLDSAVALWTDAPNVVTIGYAPNLHYASAQFGRGTRIRTEQVRPIVMAGNERFLQRLTGLGFESVGDRATALLAKLDEPPPPPIVQAPPAAPAPAEDGNGGAVAVGLAALAVVASGVALAARKRIAANQAQDARDVAEKPPQDPPPSDAQA